jgi:hypothetical protein
VSDFNELIDAGVPAEERKRLLAVHDLLLEAGPPPELPTALHDVPQPGKVSVLRQQTAPRKMALIAAAVIVLGVAFTIGYATGMRTTTTAKPVKTVEMNGTSAAPRAEAVLDVQRQVSGNLPMTLEVTGLPRVTSSEYYVVWLVRHGQKFAPCGTFVVSKPSSRALTIHLTAPYALEKGDTWIITLQTYGQHSLSPTTVLEPA